MSPHAHADHIKPDHAVLDHTSHHHVHHDHAHEGQHGHDHGHEHDHENVDYGVMYAQPWVQAMVKQIQDFLIKNKNWIGLDSQSSPRILDYACGHGTISLAVLSANPEASCRGIDLDASQADRYNNEANKAYGDNAESKMFGIQGDLYHPSENMNGPDWENFDVAVISMALHHVADPIDMLRRLRQRLRPGGVLIVVEFLGKEEEAKGSEGYDPRNMVEVVHKQKIWPGFTTGNLEGNMKRAGFEDFEVKKLETPAYVPPEASGGRMDTEMWPFFAKATVAESASL